MLHQSNKPVRVCDTCYNQKNDHLNRFRESRQSAASIPSIHNEEHNVAGTTDSSEKELVVDQLAGGALNDSISFDNPPTITERPLSVRSTNGIGGEIIGNDPTISEQEEATVKNGKPEHAVVSVASEDLTSESEDENELTCSQEDILKEPIKHQVSLLISNPKQLFC